MLFDFQITQSSKLIFILTLDFISDVTIQTTNSIQNAISTEMTEMTSSGYPTFIEGLSNHIFYVIVAFVVLFGLFVGIYFYKHCIKRSGTPTNEKKNNFSSQPVGYNSLQRGSHRLDQMGNDIEPTYLEPTAGVHYDEINNFD